MAKKTTIADIAKQLKVSKSTVSRALINHRSIGLRTRARVQQLAAELKYEPDQTAIFFKQKRTYLIGVILPYLSNEFFTELFTGIEDVVHAEKYTLLFAQSRDDVKREKELLENMKNHRVDGMLISIAKNNADYAHFEILKDKNIPVVFLDRIPQLTHMHSISSKLETGMHEAIDLLIKNGHKSIALINGPIELPASKERLTAYKTALKENKLTIQSKLIIHSDLSADDNHKCMQQLLSLDKKPSAVITFNDYVAMDVIQYAKQRHIKINKEICFVSFANEAVCNYMDNPPLASVEQFPYEQGKKAAEILLELIRKSEQENDIPSFKNIFLPSRLVIK